MATLIFALSIVISVAVILFRQSLCRSGKAESLIARTLEHVLEWSISLVLVLLFYHILLAAIHFGWPWITLGDLLTLELIVTDAHRIADQYKLTAGISLVILSLLYVFAPLWRHHLSADVPFHLFKGVDKNLRIVCIFAYLLALLTLLGSEAGNIASTLEIRIRHVRDEYGVLRNETQSALEGHAIERLSEDIVAALPDRSMLSNSIDSSSRAADDFGKAYTAAVSRGASISDSQTRQLLNVAEAQRTAFTTAGKSSVPSAEVGERAYKVPSTVTSKGIEQARTAVKEFSGRQDGYFLKFIGRAGGKDIVLKLSTLPIEHLASLLAPIEAAYPATRPVLALLKASANEAVKLRVKAQLDSVVASVIEKPGEAESKLKETAVSIAASSPHQLSTEGERRLKHEIERARTQAFEMSAASTRLANLAQPRSSARPPSSTSSPGLAGGPGTQSAGRRVVSCTCNTYRRGALISSRPIPLGAVCGGRVCGQ